MKRLVLFAKRPRLGHVKTRLVPPLEPREALELYRAFLADQLRFVARFLDDCAVEICTDGPWTAERRGLPPRLQWSDQGAGDLGRRMLRLFRRSREEGSRATVILGADCPTLPEGIVREAFRRLLEGAEAVVAPAEDGGYVLIGLRRPRPELFAAVPWGTPRVLASTRRRAEASGVPLGILDGWYDVDDVGGLRRLRRELTNASAECRAPETARCLEALARRHRGVL